jgi:molybdate transport system ATP-binding protein
LTTAPAAAFILTESATFRGPAGPVFAGCTLTILPGERWAILGPNRSGKGLLIDGLMGKLGLLAGRLRHPFLEGDPRFSDSVFGVLPPGSMALASMKEHRQWLLARGFHQRRWHGSLSDGAATVGDLLERSQVEQRNPFAVLDPSGDEQYLQVCEREIARFELGPLLHRPVLGLSNGELHRFVLARALLRQPRLLFIDDPTAGLDVRSRGRLQVILDDLAAEGIGVVLATERESELSRGITHVVQVEAHRIASISCRRASRRASSASPPMFSIPPVQGRPAPAPIAELRDVTVRQGKTTLLKAISWRLAPGEQWGLLGPNGSGKSTLLSLLLADNPQVYANHVRVAGHELGPGRSIWDQKSWLGWLSPELETYYPSDACTVEVVLSGFASSLGVHGGVTDEQQQDAEVWLDHMGLRAEAQTRFADLPTVSKRLALLARAVVHAPALLLLDEPCQGLDLDGRDALQAAIAAAVAALSAAMVYVTHDEGELPTTVTNVLVLDRGRIHYLGPRGA